jgi:hypothetical protein
VTADSLADEEIDCGHSRYSGSRPTLVVALAAEDDMMVVGVVVVVKVVDRFDFWGLKRAKFYGWNLSLKVGGPGSLYLGRVTCQVQIQLQQKDTTTTRRQCSTYNTIAQSTVITPDLTGTNKYLSSRVKCYQGIWVEVTQRARNLSRRLGKCHLTPPTQATGKSQPNREQR